MSDIFDGLDKFGFDEIGGDLFEPDEEKKEKKNSPVKDVVDTSSYVYKKQFTCPVCSAEFVAILARTGKMRLNHVEYDLRPVYDYFEPLFYDVIICDKCGYAALSQQFYKIMDSQAELIQKQISNKFKSSGQTSEFTAETAEQRFKMAVLCAKIKKAPAGEIAYLCLKLGWIFKISGDAENERLFKEQAYRGFTIALAKETPPIMGLEEGTVLYVLAALAKDLRRNEEASRLLSEVIVSKKCTEALKTKAKDLKREILDENVATQTADRL
ncbi:MAG: DUF2225 domain-containing protein [Clostridiales bacterium]|nr:DUF2225 domain-containing protein [Clostridiales bacterium]